MTTNQRFDSEQEALDHKTAHQLFGLEPEYLEPWKKWALIFPLKCHVTVRHQTDPG
jgi:hypothetical protein